MRADIHDGREHERSNQRPDTLMQDRISQDRRKPLATHGRTIHLGQNEKPPVSGLCQLPPAADISPPNQAVNLATSSGFLTTGRLPYLTSRSLRPRPQVPARWCPARIESQVPGSPHFCKQYRRFANALLQPDRAEADSNRLRTCQTFGSDGVGRVRCRPRTSASTSSGSE